MLFLRFVQDIAHIDGGYLPPVRVNVLSVGLSLAGFQVIMYGRFWVITEAMVLIGNAIWYGFLFGLGGVLLKRISARSVGSAR